MQFGVREICDVVFKAKGSGTLGTFEYRAGQPVLYIDTAKTSTIEGAGTTVYATGGKGNTRLIAWEGEKTLTFTVEDALLSELGFAILSGAGLMDAKTGDPIYVHTTAIATVEKGEGEDLIVNLEEELPGTNDKIDDNAPVFVMKMEHGSITAFIDGVTVDTVTGKKLTVTEGLDAGDQVFVDFYVAKTAAVTELTIDAENFAGYYYVEASTLFKRQSDGKELPAELIFPNVKIQSNFTFNMASTGDPSTFTFTMDAMPGYTRFDRSKKVLCVMQIIKEENTDTIEDKDSTGTGALDDIEYPVA